MDSSESHLDRIEAQKSTNDQRKPINLPFFNLAVRRILGILGYHKNREGSNKYGSEFLADLRFTDIFAFRGLYVPMSPEIYSAVSDGKQTCLEIIRSYGNPMACLKTDQGDSVLHIAAACGHIELVKSIVSECTCLLLEPNLMDQLPIHVAAHAGHVVVVVQALVAIMRHVSTTVSEEDKKRLNLYVVKDGNGDTPLHLALRAIHIETAACLVNENKQASFLPNKHGITPLYMAVESGNVSLVKEMLKTTGKDGLNLQLQGRKSLVHAALKARNTDLLDIILKKYTSLEDERDEEGNTCLSYGASIGFYQGVRMLLNRSTKSVYVPNNDGSFPIHIAAEKGHTYVAIVILERCPESRYLLNKRAQNMLHVASNSGEVSFFLFSFLFAFSFMNKLMEKQDLDGNTPPHLATINWHHRTLFYLLNNHKGNCMYIRNNKGQTPLDIAESNLQSKYIFMERMTLLVLNINTTSKKDNPEKMLSKKKMTTRSDPITVDNKDVDNKELYINTLVVVAALVATVTFAAAFTLPGGFNSSGPNLGSATLATNFKLICFMVSDILAFQYSILAIVTLLWGQLGDQALVQKSVDAALPSLFFALLCMVLGFYFGVYIAFAHVKGVFIYLNATYVIFVSLILIFLGPHVILHLPFFSALFGMFFRLYVMLVGNIYLKGVQWIIVHDNLAIRLLQRQWRQLI